jgi:hypothetical protein
MKNIYIIPTDKPSRLFKNKSNSNLSIANFRIHPDWKPQNIYITSDSEIPTKDGDWYFKKIRGSWRLVNYLPHKIKLDNDTNFFDDCRKVIITTDQDLIKDGVQAINDEFLDWYVKNPSCEEAIVIEEDYSQKCKECGEVVKRGYNCNRGCFMKSGNFIPTDKNIKYKIIIPKEGQSVIKHKLTKCYCDKLDYCDCEPKEEPKTFKELFANTGIKPTTDEKGNIHYNFKATIKQETLEDAINIYSNEYNDEISEIVKDAIKFGAKWQQERSYSEEDMKKAYSIGWITRERFDDLSPDIIYPKGLDYEEKQDYAFDLWFKQYKKK